MFYAMLKKMDLLFKRGWKRNDDIADFLVDLNTRSNSPWKQTEERKLMSSPELKIRDSNQRIVSRKILSNKSIPDFLGNFRSTGPVPFTATCAASSIASLAAEPLDNVASLPKRKQYRNLKAFHF